MTENKHQDPQEDEAQQGITIVTRDEFTTVDFEAPIRDSNKVDCTSLGRLYESTASEHRDQADNGTAHRVFRLLASVAHMHFKPDDRSEPYGPQFVMDGRRNIIPSDLRGEQSNIFADIAAGIQNPGLCARLSDIAWHNNRKLSAMAHMAIDAYCVAVQSVLEGRAEFFRENRTPGSRDDCKMLRRACQIASATGWKEPQAPRLKSLIRAVIQDAFDRNDHRGFLNAAELGLHFNIQDPAAIAANAETLTSTKGPDPHTSRELWELAALGHRRTGNDHERDRCLVSSAECLVTLAAAAGGRGMVAASFLMDAIQALRHMRNTKARREELETQLRDAQTSIGDEMGVISTPIDLTALIDHAGRSVAGVSLAQALAEFADLASSPDPEELRNEVLKQAEENPISSIMPMSMHDAEGKVVAKSPGFAGGEEDRDLALHHLIARNERLRRQCDVSGLIEPARRLIQSEHRLDQRDFRPLVEMSVIVPGDRADLFALGFARFFGGDFISALHILVPQLENSIRYILKQAEVEPSTIQSDMTQENRTLSVMLAKHHEALVGVIDPAIVFEIENLFDFRGGPAIRHQLAHGLISGDECYNTDSIYACWFIFRLCCLPWFPHWPQVADRLDQR